MYLLYFKLYISDLIENQIFNKIIKTYVCSLALCKRSSRLRWGQRNGNNLFLGLLKKKGDIRVGITFQSNFRSIIPFFSQLIRVSVRLILRKVHRTQTTVLRWHTILSTVKYLPSLFSSHFSLENWEKKLSPHPVSWRLEHP